MSFLNSVVLLFAAAGAYGTALMFGTLGEILTEKSGNLNLGVEGIMYMGGIFGLIAPNLYEAAVGEGNASPIVAILLAMEDQLAIDVLRSVDEIAEEEGKNSMVPYWLSLMPADRAATIQRKMTTKPVTLE